MSSTSVAPSNGFAFRIRRHFAARRAQVFHAWTTPEALRQWWCPAGWELGETELKLEALLPYRIAMRNTRSGSTVAVCGRFLEVRVPERLVYTWRWENAFPGMPETRVTVEFIERGAGTEVLLIHEKLPEVGTCVRHLTGWKAAWDRLEAAMFWTPVRTA